MMESSIKEVLALPLLIWSMLTLCNPYLDGLISCPTNYGNLNFFIDPFRMFRGEFYWVLNLGNLYRKDSVVGELF